MNTLAPPFVTIVSGLPRSGTSMMMRMLEAGGMPVLTDHLRTPDANNPKGYYEFEPVKRTKADPSWLADAPGKAVKMVYRLLYDLPSDGTYRVLFMRRTLQEVLASQKVMLQGDQKDDSIADDQMLRLYQRELKQFEAWILQQPNFAMLEVSYNALLQNAGPVIAEIDQFLGSNLNRQAMAEVVDAKLYRNRAQ